MELEIKIGIIQKDVMRTTTSQRPTMEVENLLAILMAPIAQSLKYPRSVFPAH